ncbi:MAG: hypothetical protein J5809_06665 [Selenomonadaceae bacterium]|nr:hypothetical protein [Selenomonadaceae bacterium]
MKNKIFIALAFVLALAVADMSFTPSVANAQSFTLKNTGSVQKFAIEGKGGWFKKDYSITVRVTGGAGQQIMVYTDTTFKYSNIEIGSYIAGSTGSYVNNGQSKTINFRGKGQMYITLGLQRARGNNVRVDIDAPGFSVRQL